MNFVIFIIIITIFNLTELFIIFPLSNVFLFKFYEESCKDDNKRIIKE